MSINIKSSQTPLSDHLRTYVEKRMSYFEKFISKPDAELQCDVELKDSAHHQKGPYSYAEINLVLDGKLYRATAEEETYEAAIDKVKDDITRELVKDKKKKRALWHRGAQKIKSWVRGV